MSKRKFDPKAPPDRWLNCPRKSEEFIAKKFLAFKTPLSKDFDVPPENVFTMDMLITSMVNSYKAKIGIIIDLTNTTRFYDPETEVKAHGIKYVKLPCSGHDKAPDVEQTKNFIQICSNFESKFPNQIIGVHCTHGFNRTGFLICAYLVENLDFSVDAAIACFARARSPGIYKQDYINELYSRYGDPEDQIPQINVYPTWDNKTRNEELNGEDDDDNEAANGENSDKMPPKKRRPEYIKANPEFAAKLNGVDAVDDISEITKIQQKVQEICSWKMSGFPGSQPVSMDINNYKYLEHKNYMVSWKADGTRYLMYICGKDQVYMLDRDNSVFKVKNLTFPKKEEFERSLENTLLDGEFVFDVDPKTRQQIPRYLIYDIIQFEEIYVGNEKFSKRLAYIGDEIIKPRHDAMLKRLIKKEYEPFSVRKKDFYELNQTKKVLSKEFLSQITHGTDGLIFQPSDDPYVPGQCDAILKWKPPSMNSVDFKLKIIYFERPGYLKEDCETGCLYVGGFDQPFSEIKLNKQLRALNEKIIECKWENNGWKFMRERTDKSYPNAYRTAMSVCGSIRHPVTEEMLFGVIDNVERLRRMPHQMAPPMQPPMAPPISNKIIK